MVNVSQGRSSARTTILGLLAGVAALVLAPTAGLAQTTDAGGARGANAADSDYEVDELVVSGAARPQPGAVVGDIPPQIQLSPRDIRAYGVSTVSELIDALAPQTNSGGQGAPVTLVNGLRISSFAEIRDIPTEAILRVDIMPEEVALKYGYPADQKVVNLVLRPRFRATTVNAGYRAPTEGGGGATTDAEANLLHIRRDRRLQLNASATQINPLLESERDLTGRSDGAFRTLSPQTRDFELNSVVTRPLAKGVGATLNLSLKETDNDSKLGLSSFTQTALERHTDTLQGHLGATVDGGAFGWRWTYTGNVDRNDTKTTTDRALTRPFTDRAHTVTTSADSTLVMNRSLFKTPAGAVSATVKGGVEVLDFDSDSLRAGVSRSKELSRNSGQLQGSLDVPLTNRNKHVLAAVGDLSANVNLAVQDLSDFGDLVTVGYGVNWSPIKPLRVIASFTRQDDAPTVQQLGDPEVVTPGVQVFDLRRGETADITRVDGGAANLNADNRRTIKLGLTLKPFQKTDLTLTANYTNRHTRDVIAAFPSASTQVEDAFPNRFLRDASGQLVQIDARPVNFDSQNREEIRWGFTYKKSLPASRPPGLPPPGARNPRAQDQTEPSGQTPGGPTPAVAASQTGERPAGDRPPGGFGQGGFRGGGRSGGGGPAGGVFQIGLYHTFALRDEIVIRPGLPSLDLLDGAAIGSGGGSPRHQIELQANLTKNGLGASLNAKWQSSTTVRAAAGAGAGDLNFSDLTTVNLRLFDDLGAQPFARRHPWLRGARASLDIKNLFDTRQQVRTAAGVTPISYQPDYLDPLGRSVRLGFRKLFF